ncbi:hypothetical protein ACSSWA_05210 [Melioribacter sp. Ez-97]|uniref:hypothetical protein n=1 Tax=Melioribacter sp. Ez-97 TaxID=3423434 RepID=UPI003ED9B6C5
MRNIKISVIILFLAGCAAKEISVNTTHITHDYYSFDLPEGWLVFDTNSSQSGYPLVLSNVSRNAFILINRINLNAELPLAETANLSGYFLKLNLGKNFNGFSDIKLEGNYAEYEFITPQGIKGRVAVKKVNENYFEITGYNKVQAADDELNKALEIIAKSLR